MDPLFSIFDSVSRRDLEGVVVEYMKNARTTLASYLSMKRQWELSKDRQDKGTTSFFFHPEIRRACVGQQTMGAGVLEYGS